MATNLLIGNAGLPITVGASYSGSLTADTSYPLDNLFGGNRVDRHHLATAASGDYRITLDLGASTTGAANFLYIARANLLQYGTVGTVTLKGHSANNYGAATTVHTAASFTSTTLYGPDSEDYIATFSTSSAFRYWFLNYNATSATKFPHSHAFFGQYLDLGVDPVDDAEVIRTRPTDGQRKARSTFELAYAGMSYTKMITLYDTYSRNRRHNPAILFTTSYHDVLFGDRVLFCRMLDMTSEAKANDSYDVSVTWEEVL